MENFPIFNFPSSSSVSMLNPRADHDTKLFLDGRMNGFVGQTSDQIEVASGDLNGDSVLGREKSSTAAGAGSEGKGGKSKGEKKVRKPRYAFQTRSHVDILDDGYRWRKYGQKAVKNNKYPRSYYKCTHQECNVKKQVQRLTKDEGIVVTTYEGMHSHPIEKSNDNFEHILSQMQIYYPSF
ncbi:hypothetical protein SLA2020_340800 [Shorea laevis]